MIYGLLFLVLCISLGLIKAARGIVEYAEQKEYERRRFRMMVAEELDRLDKILLENKQAERKSRTPSIWEMRN